VIKANLEPEVIERMIGEFVATLPVTDDPYYEEAAVRFIIREFCWAMLDRFPKQKYEISEQLGLMSEAVSERAERKAGD